MNISPSLKNPVVIGIICVIVSTLISSIDAPLCKLLMNDAEPVMYAAFNMLGIGVGMAVIYLFQRTSKHYVITEEKKIHKSDIKSLIAFIAFLGVGEITANFALSTTASGTVAVLSNLELVFTALIALLIFKESVSKRLWIGIILITLGSLTLSVEDTGSFSFSPGAIFIIISCLAYSFGNNFGAVVSKRNPVQVMMIYGFVLFAVFFILGLILGCPMPSLHLILTVMLTGFAIIGTSYLLLLFAMRYLGAARTIAISGVEPLFTVVIALLFFGEIPTFGFLSSLVIVIPGMYFAITQSKEVITKPENPNPDDTMLSQFASEKYKSARQYFTGLGFCIISCIFLFMFAIQFSCAGGISEYEISLYNTFEEGAFPIIALGALLMLCGIVLLILRHRVLAASTFIYFAIEIILLYLMADYSELIFVLGVSSALFGLLLLSAGGKQKYIYAAAHFLVGIVIATSIFPPHTFGFILNMIVSALGAVFILYLAVLCMSQRENLPLRKVLNDDEAMSFNACISGLGYYLIAMYECANVIIMTINIEMMETLSISFPVYLLAGVLIVFGLMTLFIGRIGFVSIMFVSMGFCFIILTHPSDVFVYCVGLIFFLLGIYAISRRYSNILRALLLFGCGMLCLMYPSYWYHQDILLALIFTTAITMLLALYLAFASISQKPKLPLF